MAKLPIQDVLPLFFCTKFTQTFALLNKYGYLCSVFFMVLDLR